MSDPAQQNPPPVRLVTRTIAIANQKGGVGKTTTVINLAACLAELKQTVLVIDLDPQANATSGFGLPRQEGASLYSVLLGQRELGDLIQPTAIENVNIIPSELDLAGAEVDIARMDSYLHCLRKTIQPILDSQVFRFLLIDCPPSLGILTVNALAAAHSVLIPMQCEYYAMEGLSVITRLVEQMRAEANPGVEIEGIVMTMYDGRTRLSAQVVEQVRNHFPELVYKAVIPRSVRLSEAPSFGKPVIQYDGHSPGAVAYRAFAKEFLRRVESRRAAPALAAAPSAVVPAAPALAPAATPPPAASAV